MILMRIKEIKPAASFGLNSYLYDQFQTIQT